MTPSTHPVLRTQGLTRTYGGLVALKGVTFEVRRGIVKGVLGPNGAGKTTLFDVITGLQRPSAGRVICGNEDIGGWPPERIVREKRLARTFQEGRTWGHFTVVETITLGSFVRFGFGWGNSLLPGRRVAPEEKHRAKERANELVRFVGLERQRDSVASQLSFGDQRRLELARALATGPEILLLDEPAGGLDPRESHDLARLIEKLRDGGITVLVVEHRLGLVRQVADELLVLHLGGVLAEGKPDDVMRDARVVEVYLGATG